MSGEDDKGVDAPKEPPKAQDGVEVYEHHGGNEAFQGQHDTEVIGEQRVANYWRANLNLLGVLLAIWFVVSFGFGILFVGPLNGVSFFGAKLGFWFAQQGSIYVFVALIFVYSWRMHKLERQFGVDDD